MAPSRRRGFTLVELLVVIGIIAVLLTILIPALGRARRAGQRTACASNLRQITMAMIAYTHDNEDYFPYHAGDTVHHAENWIWWETQGVPSLDVLNSPVMRYIGNKSTSTFVCPGDDPNTRAQTSSSFGPYPYSYTFNFLFSTDPNLNPARPPVRITNIKDPGNKIIMVEEDPSSINDGKWDPLVPNDISIRHDSGQTGLGARGNIAIADGHVEFATRLYCRDSDPTTGLHYDPTVSRNQ
ncbi:MAG: N-terminal cleavage protein [Phycisphaerales bacterium]|nr:N-terminal cleavage protein [Phycisphaerales bacterium]MDB5301484.1 N-terminal cleavage protein [Phycisphaerales bacterium]